MIEWVKRGIADGYAARRRYSVVVAGLAFLAAAVFVQEPALARGAPESFADLAERLSPAVVNISTSQMMEGGGVPVPGLPPGSPFEEFFEDFFERQQRGGRSAPRRVQSLGSGFVIDPKGIVITNNHVIDGADEVKVNFADGTTLPAEIVGRDPKTDLAVLRVTPESDLAFVELGDSTKARVGDWVVAIGNPFGLGGTVTAGIISAINRDINAGPYDDFIQTDASINRGNSGGPLFNLDGKVVGVNTAIISPSGGSIGIGFSIPSSTAMPVIEQLKKFGETRRGWLGVRIQSVTDEIAEGLDMGEARGALIAGVTPDGPADKAGLQPGDVVVNFNGQDVPEMRDLPRIVAETDIGSKASIKVIRDGQAKSFKVEIGRLEEADAAEAAAKDDGKNKGDRQETLGLSLSELTGPLRERFNIGAEVSGVVILDVDPASAAEEKGIRPGDVLVRVAQKKVETPEEVATLVEAEKSSGARSVLLLVSTGDGLRFVALRIDGK